MQHLALSIVFNVFLFGPMAPPGIVREKNGCLSFCVSVFVIIAHQQDLLK